MRRTNPRTGPDKEEFTEDSLDESYRRASTENEAGIRELSENMPRKAAAVLLSPGVSLESTISSSRKSDASAASAREADYHQSLGYRNIFIEREHPPPSRFRG